MDGRKAQLWGSRVSGQGHRSPTPSRGTYGGQREVTEAHGASVPRELQPSSGHSPTFVIVQPGAPVLDRGSSVGELGLWEGAGRLWTLRKTWP